MRKSRERSMAWESVELYRMIFDSARDFAIFTIDPQNRVTFWNRGARRILGFSQAEAIGKSGRDFFTPEDRRREEPEKEIATARRCGRAEDERWHLRKNGRRFWGSGLMMPLLDDQKRVIGYLKILRDLTDRKQAQDALVELNRCLEERVHARTGELEKSDRQLRELARQLTRTERLERQRIAADLHDNLGQILALAQMKIAQISSSVSVGEEIAQSARDVRDYLDEAVKYTRALMSSLSPPPLGKAELAPALKWLAGDMTRHGLKVTVSDDGKAKRLAPDVQAVLFQAVRELLYNVRKHSGVAKAAVRVTKTNGEVRVDVSDDGVGFDNAKSDADDSRSGFGLYHVSERLKLFGGRLEVDRKRQTGTRVVVTAPLESGRGRRQK
jgi:PAS domain S-box-containing protein